MEKFKFAVSFNERRIGRGEWRSSEITCEVILDNVDRTLGKEIMDVTGEFRERLEEIVSKTEKTK